MPEHVKERQFETDVVESLVAHGGYTQGLNDFYDVKLGIDGSELLAFIGATQIEKWNKLIDRLGGDPNETQLKFKQRLASELDKHGTLHVLRKGVEEQGVRFDLAYFRPAHSKNPELVEAYSKNRLTVTRQLRYSAAHGNSVDLCLMVNGLPVATAELKHHLNGQTVDNAIWQYEHDRDSKDVLFRRALVHFAVDTRLAYMTTRLEGASTAFLPFNRGSAPGELSCGKGNPPNPDGYATAYLWERVWAYDSWLDILGRFVERVVEPALDKKPARTTVIFPRFHQWDAVVRLAGDAKQRGPGQSYLVQHSAGSGKSNSIGWLAHRLSLLHADDDAKVFDKIIVVTDRRALDEQLRATVSQFESVPGTIVSVEGKKDSKSEELAKALGGKAQIVTVTLETFPHVIAKLDDVDLASQRFAIIVDEAHSSQTGDAATALKQALGAKAADASEDDDDFDAETALAAIVAARGRQPNLSFFAFTATPKDRTVELFGVLGPDKVKRPFHLYTMRQAIEEEFILDVLANYTTYSTYFRLATTDDAEIEVDVSKASSAIRKFIWQHPHMIGQKAAIVVEHFRAHTGSALGGRAKAMVVTESRAAAVRYKQAIDRHIAEHQYTDIKSLVAFSGEVIDDSGQSVTESSMNAFPDSQTARRFKGEPPYSPGDYQVMVVAEKFQTGFDEPYLHTMFVDKKLSGLNAVQTLSRLNRGAPGKADTFVLDFRNEADEIRNAFQRYYEAVIVEPTDANVLYDLRARIMGAGIFDPIEITKAAEAYFGVDPAKRSLKVIHANLDPAVVRFGELAEDAQDALKDGVDQFTRAYAFLSQVMPFTDPELEKLYVYVKALRTLLRDAATGGLDLGDDLVLTHLRLKGHGSEDLKLAPGEIEASKVFIGEGLGGRHEAMKASLAELIAEINDRFGTDLDERDRLEAEKVQITLSANEELKTYAKANPIDNFALEFSAKFKSAILDTEAHTERLYNLLLTNPELAAMIEHEVMKATYHSMRDEGERDDTSFA
ncbi:MAG: type I restriction endonuclease subunit R [Actinobacteria bacterium]|nr:type I restriction endonuclease subunit R [Actinomycetota bacterium]